MLKRIVALLVVLAFSLVGCRSSEEPRQMTISAASSLQLVLATLATSFEKSHPDVKVTLNFGSSGTLKQQIDEGAPVDLFLSADARLVSKPIVFAHNELVLIAPAKKQLKFDSLAVLLSSEVHSIAIGQPELVPAGNYARQFLQGQHVYESLVSKFILATSVRQVLSYVETGAVDAGFVYRTDARSSEKVRIDYVVPNEWHEPIVYAGEVTKQAKNKQDAEAFLDYVAHDQKARTILEQNGFLR